jgi:hypothetical protein
VLSTKACPNALPVGEGDRTNGIRTSANLSHSYIYPCETMQHSDTIACKRYLIEWMGWRGPL